MVHGKTERRSQTNIANKLPIQFSYAENTASPLLRSATSLFLLAPEFSSYAKKSSPQLIARVGFFVVLFQSSAIKFAPVLSITKMQISLCRILTDLLPSENYVRISIKRLITKKTASILSLWTRAQICCRKIPPELDFLFNVAIKSDICEEFSVISLRYFDVSVNQTVEGENLQIIWETSKKRAINQEIFSIRYFACLK